MMGMMLDVGVDVYVDVAVDDVDDVDDVVDVDDVDDVDDVRLKDFVWLDDSHWLLAAEIAWILYFLPIELCGSVSITLKFPKLSVVSTQFGSSDILQ